MAPESRSICCRAYSTVSFVPVVRKPKEAASGSPSLRPLPGGNPLKSRCPTSTSAPDSPPGLPSMHGEPLLQKCNPGLGPSNNTVTILSPCPKSECVNSPPQVGQVGFHSNLSGREKCTENSHSGKNCLPGSSSAASS